MTRYELLKYIAAAIHKKGGIEKASGSWDIQVGNLRAVSEGRVQPGPRLTKLLGLTQKADGEWVVTRKFAEDK
jgi:hypothetical protein